jgi:hypothetical protein
MESQPSHQPSAAPRKRGARRAAWWQLEVAELEAGRKAAKIDELVSVKNIYMPCLCVCEFIVLIVCVHDDVFTYSRARFAKRLWRSSLTLNISQDSQGNYLKI